jgi:hypothetical protein
MSNSASLGEARKHKNDEFYTQLSDIEKELSNYKAQFKDKVILCNCDDPYESNFFKYFAMNFNQLGLKKLITTSYSGSPIVGSQLPLFQMETSSSKIRPAYKVEITSVPDLNEDGAIDLGDVKLLLQQGGNELSLLKGDGDFRSPEAIELLKEADIVVTNPPFSLFREFMQLIAQHDKKFAVIGNLMASSSKEIFPLIFDGKIWFGPSISSGDREFQVPEYYPLEAASCRVDDLGRRFIRVKGVRWYVNLDHSKRHEKIPLFKKYDPEIHPEFDNYKAIFVDKVVNIPAEYAGAMGVPLTFLDKHNPDQFQFLDANDFRKAHQDNKSSMLIKDADAAVMGKNKFVRILVKRADMGGPN